jgi:hypothetical protein
MTQMTRPAGCTQPMRALELANRVRSVRSELKTRIAAGELSAAEMILSCPPELSSLSIGELLSSQRGWGEVRCRALLAQVALREDKSIGSLTDRQRQAVVSQLARQLGAPNSTQSGPPPVRGPMPMRRRSLNEAAHKLPAQAGAHGRAR